MRRSKQEKYAYEARIALWLSRDPIYETGGLNLYGYVGNGPINWIDPWGLTPLGARVSNAGTAIQGVGAAAVVTGAVMSSTIVGAPAGVPVAKAGAAVVIAGTVVAGVGAVITLCSEEDEPDPVPVWPI